MKEPLRMNQLFGVRQVSFTKQFLCIQHSETFSESVN